MSSTLRIAPSILSADFARLGEEVRAIEAAGADLVHFDVMDNHYVPNLTIGPLVCEAIRPHVKIGIDVHLMVEPVDALVPMFAKAGANIITFHPEASRHVDRTLALIRDHGCKAGLVFNPATPLDWLDHVMDKLDMVLLMSVNPGFGGQKFIEATLPKLAAGRAGFENAIRLAPDLARRPRIEPEFIGGLSLRGGNPFHNQRFPPRNGFEAQGSEGPSALGEVGGKRHFRKRRAHLTPHRVRIRNVPANGGNKLPHAGKVGIGRGLSQTGIQVEVVNRLPIAKSDNPVSGVNRAVQFDFETAVGRVNPCPLFKDLSRAVRSIPRDGTAQLKGRPLGRALKHGLLNLLRSGIQPQHDRIGQGVEIRGRSGVRRRTGGQKDKRP
jgi:ribulose-phosphate 3-epimerase